MNRFFLPAIALLAAALAVPPASARPSHHAQHTHRAAATAGRAGQHQYVVIQDFNPRLFEKAARTARDTVRAGQVTQFRIILAARGVLLAVQPITVVQREVAKILRSNRRIELVACREVVAALTKVAHRRPPLLPGTRVLPCHGLHAAMERAGWQPVPGL
jgi:hypothetical protein